jgi:hypothetical protein
MDPITPNQENFLLYFLQRYPSCLLKISSPFGISFLQPWHTRPLNLFVSLSLSLSLSLHAFIILNYFYSNLRLLLAPTIFLTFH